MVRIVRSQAISKGLSESVGQSVRSDALWANCLKNHRMLYRQTFGFLALNGPLLCVYINHVLVPKCCCQFPVGLHTLISLVEKYDLS